MVFACFNRQHAALVVCPQTLFSNRQKDARTRPPVSSELAVQRIASRGMSLSSISTTLAQLYCPAECSFVKIWKLTARSRHTHWSLTFPKYGRSRPGVATLIVNLLTPPPTLDRKLPVFCHNHRTPNAACFLACVHSPQTLDIFG